MASILSPSSACWRIVLPHCSHLCVMIKPSPDFSTPTGRIIPPHVAVRSPGLLSTWRDHKQFGQWFVYPLPRTRTPQCAQVKSSTRRVNFFIITPTRCDTSGSVHLLRPVRPDPICAGVSSGVYILGQIRRIWPRYKSL